MAFGWKDLGLQKEQPVPKPSRLLTVPTLTLGFFLHLGRAGAMLQPSFFPFMPAQRSGSYEMPLIYAQIQVRRTAEAKNSTGSAFSCFILIPAVHSTSTGTLPTSLHGSPFARNHPPGVLIHSKVLSSARAFPSIWEGGGT